MPTFRNHYQFFVIGSAMVMRTVPWRRGRGTSRREGRFMLSG